MSHSQTVPADNKTFNIIVLVVSGSFIAVGILIALMTFPLYFNGQKATGEVIDRVESPSAGLSYSRLIEFETTNNEKVQFRERISTGSPDFVIGDQVPVRYDVNDPYHAIVAEWDKVFLFPIIFLSLGGIALIGGLLNMKKYKLFIFK